MDWYLRDIVIYGKDNTLRHVQLERGVNIITGDSQTGKTVLISIVDYCLGSSECEVFVGDVRDFARWYGIRIQTPSEQIFLARQDPGKLSASANMFISIGRDSPIPEPRELMTNTKVEAVVKELSRRLGMMEESLEESPYDRFVTEPPSVRNVAPFLFQPQWIIANKDMLFYKTDPDRHSTHRQRLQRIFPYVLGAITADYFRLKGDLDAAQKQLRQVERKLAVQETLLGASTSNASTLLDRARALGLTRAEQGASAVNDSSPIGNERALDDFRLELATILEAATGELQLEASEPASAGRITQLSMMSRTLREQLRILRGDLSLAEEMRQEAQRYSGSLQRDSERLSVTSILPELNPSSRVCPVCNQPVDHISPTISQLRKLNDDIRMQLDGISFSAPALTAHIEAIRGQIADQRRQLEEVESELKQLYSVQAEAISANRVWAEQQRHLGAIRYYLEHTPTEQSDLRDLRQQQREKRHLVERINHEIARYDVTERRDTALGTISQLMSNLGKQLNLERPDASIRLDIKNLTVVRDSPSGRPERLYEIGSGENWVGYHLVALLALHTFFIQHNSPVPSILFLDQPSQIYFPQEEMSETAESKSGKREDWEAIRSIYRMIFRAAESLEGKLQVIALDHVELLDPPEFEKYNRIRWRHGRRLI
jgi:uncharacterized protein DUF3732